MPLDIDTHIHSMYIYTCAVFISIYYLEKGAITKRKGNWRDEVPYRSSSMFDVSPSCEKKKTNEAEFLWLHFRAFYDWDVNNRKSEFKVKKKKKKKKNRRKRKLRKRELRRRTRWS
jgi:hypothetical protein